MAIAGALADPPGPAPTRAPGHVVIKFSPDKARAFLKGKPGVSLQEFGRSLDLPAGAALEESGFARWAKERRRDQKAQADSEPVMDFDHFMYLNLPPGLTPEQCVERLKNHPLVEYVEIDPVGEAAIVTPTDPWYSSQWQLQNGSGGDYIHAPEAWGITTGTQTVIVAILDSGCATNIAEFQGRTVPGYNFVSTNTDIRDDFGHGTAVAGVLCASANNGANIAGVDWHCRLMPVKVLDKGGSGYYSWWAQGISWAVSNGAKVINISAGGTDTLGRTSLSNAILSAVSNGAIIVAATHNDGMPQLRFPASHQDAIAVGATDPAGKRCGFSNYGTNISLVAPGTNIYTVGTNEATLIYYGTSVATPHVAGVASLICSIRPDLNNEQVRALLCAGADDKVSSDPNDLVGYDLRYGWGRLNAYNSLLLARPEIASFAVTNTGEIVFSWPCAPNASNKLPCKIEYCQSLASNQWTAVSNITYGTSTAVWTDSDATNQPTRFYRVKVKDFRPGSAE